MKTHLLAVLPLALAGCATEPDVAEGISLLPPRQQLIRLSVDMRGVHPSEAELQAFANNPGLYEDYVDRWLDDDRLLSRMRELFNERLLVSTGGTYMQSHPGASGRQVANALSGESLRLVERIIDQDLPYSELVTADYTMANSLLAEMWDLERSGGAEWAPARYTDGREHAGILTMSSIWLRYPSAGGNANRHRANAVSKMLLCSDYLSRPIVLNRAAVDQLIEDPETAISSNASCQSCHSTLDPLSAHFFGWFAYDDDDDFTAAEYRPENEQDWMLYAGDAPAYYGTPTAGLAELGTHLAADPRFADCAVQTVWEGLTQRQMEDADWDELQDHRETFVASGLLIKPLIKSVVMSDEYRAGSLSDQTLGERLPTVKVASPAQLDSIIEDLTGYQWTFGGTPGLRSNGMGLPVLLGGIDSANVEKRAYKASVGGVFVHERLAWSAAWHVVTHDLDPNRQADARLLKYVTVESDPEIDSQAFDQQVRYLYERVTGIPLAQDASEPANLIVLWRQLHSVEGSVEAAWAGVVSAVLRDPLVLHY